MALVLKWDLDDQVTNGQLGHIAVYTCVYRACPAEHLGSDFVTVC